MKLLTKMHRYLSCFVAPAMLFFAVSGAWQAFRLQDTKKDGSYVAPVVLQTLSHVHKAERLSKGTAWLFRAGQVTIASIFVATALVGIAMAFRFTKPVWLAWACLLAGILLPALLAYTALNGGQPPSH